MIPRITLPHLGAEFGIERAHVLFHFFEALSCNQCGGLYLDVGAGDLTNTLTFMQGTGLEAVAIDVSIQHRDSSLHIVRATAEALPFRDESFSLVTSISLIEHVNNQDACLRESVRVLKSGGEFFMQFPNRYFPIELHSGIFFYYYLPAAVRRMIAGRLRRFTLTKVDVPTTQSVLTILQKFAPGARCVTCGFTYPEEVLKHPVHRSFLHVFRRLGLLRMFPMGQLIYLKPL